MWEAKWLKILFKDYLFQVNNLMSFIFSKLFWPLVNTFSNVSTHTPMRYFDLSLLAKQLSYFRIIWTLPIWNSSQSFKLHPHLKGRSSTLLVYSPPLWRAKKTKKYLRTSRLQSSNSATRERCLNHFKWKRLLFIKEIRLTSPIL